MSNVNDGSRPRTGPSRHLSVPASPRLSLVNALAVTGVSARVGNAPGHAVNPGVPGGIARLGRSVEPDPIRPQAQHAQVDRSALSDVGRPPRSDDNGLPLSDRQPSNESSQTDPSESDDDPPSLRLQRHQSSATTYSQCTNILTPNYPPDSLPTEPMSLAQQVWRHRKTRKRILRHMDLPTLATMCRVNRRMYTNAIAVLAYAVENEDMQRTVQMQIDTGSAHARKRRFRTLINSVRELTILERIPHLNWKTAHAKYPNVRTVYYGDDVPVSLERLDRFSRYGLMTFILQYPLIRDINALALKPSFDDLIEIPAHAQIIRRYVFYPDAPLLYSVSPSVFTEFSPIGDQIWSIVLRNPMTFEFAYETLRLCVERLRCPREFTWHRVHLKLWRITLVQLYKLLELLQAGHLVLGELRIDTEFRAEGTLTTKEFIMAGPVLWRLLQVFTDVGIDFRHEDEPLPKPGKGPKGLSAFMETERLQLATFTAAGALPPNVPMERWKWTFNYIFGAFCQCIMIPEGVYYTTVTHETARYKDTERERLFKAADIKPIWAEFTKSVKSKSTFDFMWEWEHGSPAPKKVGPPGWSKVTAKKPNGTA